MEPEKLVERTYSGTANNYADAQKQMYEKAQKDGATPAGEVMYTVGVEKTTVTKTIVTGAPNKDYNTAVQSALQKAGLTEANKLEVTATQTFKAKPTPSGAGPKTANIVTLTDLF